MKNRTWKACTKFNITSRSRLKNSIKIIISYNVSAKRCFTFKLWTQWCSSERHSSPITLDKSHRKNFMSILTSILKLTNKIRSHQIMSKMMMHLHQSQKRAHQKVILWINSLSILIKKANNHLQVLKYHQIRLTYVLKFACFLFKNWKISIKKKKSRKFYKNTYRRRRICKFWKIQELHNLK